MRLSVLPVVLLATTVVADGASILAAMAKISDSTTRLNTTVADFAGGLIGLVEAIPLLTESATLLKDIKDGTKTATSSAVLTVDETLQVAGATSDLVTAVQSSLQTIVDTKEKFDELLIISPVILINLEEQKKATDKFGAAVISKVPEAFQDVAKGLIAPIDVAFDNAISKYKSFFGRD